MALKAHSLSVIILSLLIASSIVSANSDQKLLQLGSPQQITDLTDPKVLEAADFSVARHNKLAKSNLKFQSVINGTVQVLGGRLYRLVISAIDGNASQNYLARVYDKPWQQLKILISFEKIASLV
ncbi:cysteine proteinase inhibitor 5 [Phtheirospermum japonicum]|uniref:Cysteine proteinase inhibitor 5 n=1 Tax=Phtheirospermum japonicum TaxID=374723 RepID=A0A830DAC8_9LAMI|nr:cysteine proteinase inhibitor 5 [Phtheirospermum japonicum]